MKTKPPRPDKPVSIRIDPDTRAALNVLVEKTGLKEAQLFRMGIREMAQRLPRRTAK